VKKSGGEIMGEKKFFSHVKELKEIESEYREKLMEAKNPPQVVDVFIDTTFKLLKKIVPDLDLRHIEHISFAPEEEIPFHFDKPLRELLESYFDNSDLEQIIAKLAETAKHRYMQILHDEDRTDMFRR